MRRRDVIAGLVLASTLCRAQAQQSAKRHRIAMIDEAFPIPAMDESNVPEQPLWRPFFAEMRRLGYVEGQNLTIERYTGRLFSSDLAREVTAGDPDLIVCTDNLVAHDLIATTDTIPIVAIMGNPVGDGLATALAHPGANLTGVDLTLGWEVRGKRMQLLREMVPNLCRMGYLTVRAVYENVGKPYVEKLAKGLGITVVGPFLERPVTEAEIRRG